jgi:hypothetical protein
MTDDKSSKNSFANLLNNVKKNQGLNNGKQQKTLKPNKGFGAPNLVKRSGRGR